jgi:hypothetical protein
MQKAEKRKQEGHAVQKTGKHRYGKKRKVLLRKRENSVASQCHQELRTFKGAL